MTDTYLVDVSRYQGAVDWRAYAQFSRAAVCKATQGTTSVDPQFGHNQPGMRATLAVRGFYHFLTAADPATQARHFANVVGPLRPGEFAVLDVEQDTDQARHERFCAEADRLLGGVTWLYGGQQVRSSRPVWVARYPRGVFPDAAARWQPGWAAPAGEPSVPHVLWQFTDYGAHVPGIGGNVDVNVHRGDLASLARFALPEDDDMTPDEHAMLKRIDERLEILAAPRRADGSDPDPTHVSVADVDDRVRRLAAAVQQQTGALPGGGTFNVSGSMVLTPKE